MYKRLAIIPARIGSKRIKEKNIRKLHGKHLICYSLQAALGSRLFDKIHVSTDSIKIKKISQRFVEFDFYRPKNLSGDNVPVSKVIKYVIKKFENKKIFFDEVWLIYATNPFINKKIIKKAYHLFLSFKKKFPLMTVTKYNFPIEWAMRIKKNKLFIENNFLYKKKSNKLEPKYAEAGMFVIYPKFFFKSKFSFKRYIGFEVPLWSSVDIDNKDDFKFAEKIISSR